MDVTKAIGLAYQHYLDPEDASVGLDMYYSHAPSKNLGTTSGTYTDSVGALQTYTDMKRIAGSNAAGLSPEVDFHPWQGADTTLQINYDTVHYNTVYRSSVNANGLGGTLKFDQQLTDHIMTGISAAIRAPFNDYQAKIGLNNLYYHGLWGINLMGDYVAGKKTLGNSYTVGLGMSYKMDQPRPTEGLDQSAESNAHTLLNWTAKPAVYMPTVLAIADEKVTTASACTAPEFGVDIDTLIFSGPSPTYDAGPFFTGTNLRFSITRTVNLGVGATINASSGLISFSSSGNSKFIVTATNACGSASSNEFQVFVS